MLTLPVRLMVAAMLVAAAVETNAQSGEVFYACVAPDGVMRLVDAGTACKKNEQAVSWNIQGPKGDQGSMTLPDGRCWTNRFRYVDCGNGTVTDQLTGLIWLKDSTCLSAMTYADANRSAQRLKDGDCGLSDKSVPGQWRLPTLAEWQATTAVAAGRACQPALTDNSGLRPPFRKAEPCFIGIMTRRESCSAPAGSSSMPAISAADLICCAVAPGYAS